MFFLDGGQNVSNYPIKGAVAFVDLLGSGGEHRDISVVIQ